MATPLQVGIFGFYSYQNLGDNLMACLFAQHVKDSGHEPIIFSKADSGDMDWGFPTCGDVKEFVDNADIIVFGGGGLLLPRRKLSEIIRDFNEDLGQILERTGPKATPLLGLSLGGAGCDFEQIVPEVRKELVRRLDYVTLRNREDLKLLAPANSKGEFVDDVVWTTARKLPRTRNRKNSARLRVGVNLDLGSLRRPTLVKLFVWLITSIRRDLDFVFIEVHPTGQHRAFCADLSQSNCSNKIMTNIEDACTAVASIDLLITSRLHIGVMAMSYGVPTIAYAGEEKTKLLYKRIGRSAFFWPIREVYRLLQLFLVPGAINGVIDEAGKPIDPAIVDNAMQHYTVLSNLLDSTVQGAQQPASTRS